MTDNTQPEALRLADILQHKIPSIECLEVAAKELRRLHELNQKLLEALKEIVNQHGQFEHCLWAAHIARKAIAKAEEQA